MYNDEHDAGQGEDYEPRACGTSSRKQVSSSRSKCVRCYVCGFLLLALGLLPYFYQNVFGWNGAVACLMAICCFCYGAFCFFSGNRDDIAIVSWRSTDSTPDKYIIHAMAEEKRTNLDDSIKQDAIRERIEERREDKLLSRRHRHRLNAARRKKEQAKKKRD